MPLVKHLGEEVDVVFIADNIGHSSGVNVVSGFFVIFVFLIYVFSIH